MSTLLAQHNVATNDPARLPIEHSKLMHGDDSLNLLSLALAHLCCEANFDGCNTASTTARVACDEVEPVLSLVQIGIW